MKKPWRLRFSLALLLVISTTMTGWFAGYEHGYRHGDRVYRNYQWQVKEYDVSSLPGLDLSTGEPLLSNAIDYLQLRDGDEASLEYLPGPKMLIFQASQAAHGELTAFIHNAQAEARGLTVAEYFTQMRKGASSPALARSTN